MAKFNNKEYILYTDYIRIENEKLIIYIFKNHHKSTQLTSDLQMEKSFLEIPNGTTRMQRRKHHKYKRKCYTQLSYHGETHLATFD